jgi:biopolymer transport protein ExbD
MKFRRKSGAAAVVPTSSMADLAFLLLVFFMVTTVFAKDRGLKIVFPVAEATERLPTKRNLANIWVNAGGNISIDDKIITTTMVAPMVSDKIGKNPKLTVILKIDRNAEYGIPQRVMEELKRAQAYKVWFATEYERR